MQNRIVKECLQQLIKVYAFSEQQYIFMSLQHAVPILKVFFEQRAFERMLFIEEVEQVLIAQTKLKPFSKTLEQLYEYHNQIYGKNTLNTTLIANIDSMIIDEKALEICHCLLADDLHKSVREVLLKQSDKIESSILSMVYLNALYKD